MALLVALAHISLMDFLKVFLRLNFDRVGGQSDFLSTRWSGVMVSTSLAWLAADARLQHKTTNGPVHSQR